MQGQFTIKSDAFPILEGEEMEIINPNTYGKSLALYLKENLINFGHEVPFICCEDSGWWIEIKTEKIISGLMCVQDFEEDNLFHCNLVKPNSKAWVWKKLKFMDVSDIRFKIAHDVFSIFSSDPRIQILDFK
jgi:hypothetical protein